MWASAMSATADTRMRRGAASSDAAGPRSPAPPRPPPLAERGRREDRGLQLPVPLDGEQRRKHRHPADEVMGPVDRVDVPAGRRFAGLDPVLLADEAVVRVCRADPGPDHPLDRRVGLRDERPVGLGRDLQVAAKRRAGDRVCLVGGLVGQRKPLVQLRLRRSGARGGPGGPEGHVVHDRSRSPAGS